MLLKFQLNPKWSNQNPSLNLNQCHSLLLLSNQKTRCLEVVPL
jgi:hypothetical protein